MQRKLLIAGNWKMHGSLNQVSHLVEGIKAGAKHDTEIDILLFPTYVHLNRVRELLNSTNIALGAQNTYPGTQGAFTGEVSAPMLADMGCQFVLIGHSERRSLFHEDLKLIAAKFKSVIEVGLIPVLCVGETREQRESGQTESVIKSQLESVIHFAGIDTFAHAVIAYEPVWAIGTGLTATPEEAQAVHLFIRRLIAQNNVDLAKTIRILYGGSMKADNAQALLAMDDIDGGLIGGASLEAASFLAICKIAQSLTVVPATIARAQAGGKIGN